MFNFELNTEIDNYLTINDIKPRPNAQTGVWLFTLLPFAIILSFYKNQKVSTEIYQINTILSTGLLVTSVILIFKFLKKLSPATFNFYLLIVTAAVATVLRITFYKGLFISLITGYFISFGYIKILFSILKLFPKSFSFGEATICAEAFSLFLFSSFMNIYNSVQVKYEEKGNISTIIIQVGLLGIALICLATYNLTFLRKITQFYSFALTGVFLFILLPLHIFLRQSPLLWIINLLIADFSTIKIFLYWAVCSIIAALIIRKQIENGKKASTAVRKVFHILAVAVYLPGLLYQCNLLYLASGVVLGIFAVLELLRILNIKPLGPILEDGFCIYSDEKDVGLVALTPIYLLVGCSLPLWIHPDPCDILDSAGFNLLPLTSGLLSIGIGDTAASIVGITVGRYKWPGSQKTVEGTVACISSQLVMVFFINMLGYAELTTYQVIKAIFGIIFCSYVEAFTDQIDNLVLPFILYIILL